jgi:hypothetical protein
VANDSIENIDVADETMTQEFENQQFGSKPKYTRPERNTGDQKPSLSGRLFENKSKFDKRNINPASLEDALEDEMSPIEMSRLTLAELNKLKSPKQNNAEITKLDVKKQELSENNDTRRDTENYDEESDAKRYK